MLNNSNIVKHDIVCILSVYIAMYIFALCLLFLCLFCMSVCFFHVCLSVLFVPCAMGPAMLPEF